MFGRIDYDRELGECIDLVDGKFYRWGELGRNIAMFEGWKTGIEFIEAEGHGQLELLPGRQGYLSMRMGFPKHSP